MKYSTSILATMCYRVSYTNERVLGKNVRCEVVCGYKCIYSFPILLATVSRIPKHPTLPLRLYTRTRTRVEVRNTFHPHSQKGCLEPLLQYFHNKLFVFIVQTFVSV